MQSLIIFFGMPDKPKDKLDSKALVSNANGLLVQLHVDLRIREWTEIDAALFVLLFEGVCGEKLRDVVEKPVTREEEAHNCQIVIDTLSMDIINYSLSHITGEDIVKKNKQSISDLLDVFTGLLEYVLDKISSKASSEKDNNEDGLSDCDDLDLVTPDVIEDVLSKELVKERTASGEKFSAIASKSATALGASTKARWELCGDDTEGLIALGLNSRKSAGDASFNSRSLETTADLIELGEVNAKGQAKSTKFSQTTAKSKSSILGDSIKDRAISCDGDGLETRIKARPVNGGSSERMKNLQTTGENGLRRDNAKDFSRTVHVSLPRESSSAHEALEQFRRPIDSDDSSLVNSLVKQSVDNRKDGDHEASEFSGLGGTKRIPHLSASMPLGGGAIKNAGDLSTEKRHHIFTHHLYHHYDRTGDALKQLGHSLQSSAISSFDAPPKRVRSIEDIEALVQDTINLTRAALGAGPKKDGPIDNLPKSAVHSQQSNVLKEYLKTSSEQVSDLSKASSISERSQINSTLERDPYESITSQKRREVGPRKKVSFQTRNLRDEMDILNRNSNGMPAVNKGNLRYGKEDQLNDPLKSRNVGLPLSATHPPISSSRVAREGVSPETVRGPEAPQTFRDYLEKYYGRERLRSYSDSDLSRLGSDPSDLSFAGYEQDVSSSRSVKSQLPREGTRHDTARNRNSASKAVHFDEIVDTSAPGHMIGIQKKLRKENLTNQKRTGYLASSFAGRLADYKQDIEGVLKKPRERSQLLEQDFKKEVLKKKLTPKIGNKYPAVHKGVLINRSHSNAVRPSRSANRTRRRSASASPTVGRANRERDYEIEDGEILPWLLDEFPYMGLSAETLHNLWRKSVKQTEQLARAEQEEKLKRSGARMKMSEAELRQNILFHIIQEDLAHDHRLSELKERRKAQQSVKAKIRERRQQHARCMKYYEQYQVQMRSKMMKKRTREEQVFKKLFRDALDIQRDRIRDLRKYAKEQRAKQAEEQQNQVESLENYYKDQFEMLSEILVKERDNIRVRERAQGKIMEQRKKEVRKEMEKQIKSFQEQVCQDEDDTYYRELDADRLRRQLQLAKYQVRV